MSAWCELAAVGCMCASVYLHAAVQSFYTPEQFFKDDFSPVQWHWGTTDPRPVPIDTTAQPACLPACRDIIARCDKLRAKRGLGQNDSGASTAHTLPPARLVALQASPTRRARIP